MRVSLNQRYNPISSANTTAPTITSPDCAAGVLAAATKPTMDNNHTMTTMSEFFIYTPRPPSPLKGEGWSESEVRTS